MPMVKSSTLFRKPNEQSEAAVNKVSKKQSNIFYFIDDNMFSPSKKSIEFILNFSKSYRTKKLKNGNYVDMNIN